MMVLVFPGLMLLLTIILLLYCTATGESKVIFTKNGYLKGAEVLSKEGQLIHKFKHVPISAAPIGEFRFAYLQPKLPWKGVRDATEYGPSCLSNSTTTKSPQKWVDEDCLHANIFVSDNCLNSECPVVTFIHGGQFNFDSAVMFQDKVMVESFAAKDVVLVILPFRLGFTSHLSFADDSVVPRNLAFHDIIHGLEWVQENIASFGGNASHVTLFGHSSGGSAVLTFMFSKLVDPQKRLFHRGIAMSPLMQFSDDLSLRQMTLDFAFRLGCSTFGQDYGISNNVVREIVDCLRRKPGSELLKMQREMEEEGVRPVGLLTIPPVLPLTDLIHHPPSRDFLCGATSRDMDHNSGNFSSQLADLLGFRHPVAIGRKYVNDRHSGNRVTNHSTETETIYLQLQKYAHAMQKTGAKTYLYEYSNDRHADHSEYLSYFMGVHGFEHDDNEQHLAKIIPDLFINFVKTGAPNEEWLPLEEDKDNYYNINVDVKSGVWPQNMEYFEREVISYWMKNLTEFDQMLSEDEKHPRRLKASISIRGEDTVLPVHLQRHHDTIVVVLLVLTALIIYFFVTRRKRSVVISGTHEEKIPLSQLII